MTPDPSTLAPSALSLLALLSPASAQCPPHWAEGAGLPGAGVYVGAASTWAPAGRGPDPERLVVGRDFQLIGTQTLRGLAGGDGAAWRDIDPNSGGDIFTIRALAVYHGDLTAAGYFATLGGVAANCIARFDGRSW